MATGKDFPGFPPKLRDELIDKRVAAAQTDSTAPDIATLKTDFNALLAKLRAAGLMK